MKKLKQIFLFIIIIALTIITSGCTVDDMDDINIIVTNYPNEFILDKLYGSHSTIKSIYPDGVKIDEYKISKKQKNEYAQYDLFIYNGLIENERTLAVELLDINPNLKIIDTAYVLETDYSPEELWLNPSSLLMMSQNVRLGLKEYISSNYLKKEVDEAYNNLKIELSELDAEYRVAVESTDDKTIVSADSALNYLEKFGLNVICIDTDASQKDISNASNAFDNKNVSYIITFVGEKDNENVKKIIDEYTSINKIELYKLDILSDEQRSNGDNYITIMKQNLELLKKELYQ
jgi:zinc transport system substrate-binding protein